MARGNQLFLRPSSIPTAPVFFIPTTSGSPTPQAAFTPFTLRSQPLQPWGLEKRKENEDLNPSPKKSRTETSDDFKCLECNQTFTHQTSLKRHLLTHDQKFRCLQCDKPFTNSRNLKRHMRLHSGDQRKCYLCDECFSTVAALQAHRRQHKETENSFMCIECNKTFPSKGELKKHILGHDPQKIYQEKRSLGSSKVFKCGDCSLTFSSKRLLGEHIETHDPDEDKEEEEMTE